MSWLILILYVEDLATAVCKSAEVALRFGRCCDRAFKGALKLVSFCTGKPESTLEACYRKWCDSGAPMVNEDEIEPEELLEQMDGGQMPGSENSECQQVLECAAVEAPLIDPEGADTSNEKQLPANYVELAFAKVSDQEELNKLLTEEGEKEGNEYDQAQVAAAEQKPGHLPLTLVEAMACPGDRWNALWRMALRLRSTRGGVDRRWINNPRKARRASRGLNWFQCLVLIYVS